MGPVQSATATAVEVSPGRWREQALSTQERTAARLVLTDLGLTPHALARRTRPVVLVDVVNLGSTFTELFTLLDDWIAENREPWDVVRRKIRFIGVTTRESAGPTTWRWHQHAAWTRRLPAASVVNVPLDREVWSYLGDHQTKLTRSLRPHQWVAAADGPHRDGWTRHALAEAVALVAHGRGRGRRGLVRAFDGEPALARPWLRSLVRQLKA